jgi:hypothetical protein
MPAATGSLRNMFRDPPAEPGGLRWALSVAATFRGMKKWRGLLLIGLMGCAGRTEQGYFPVAARLPIPAAPIAALDTAAGRPSAAVLVAPATNRPAGVPLSRARRPAPLRPPAPATLVRRLGRHHAHVRQPVAQTPANHAVDGLGKLLLVAAIAAALLLVAVIIAFTAPATVLGAIGKVLLWGLGGVLLVTLLNGLEQALFPDRRRS